LQAALEAAHALQGDAGPVGPVITLWNDTASSGAPAPHTLIHSLTHTHTQTHIKRERESVCACICMRERDGRVHVIHIEAACSNLRERFLPAHIAGYRGPLGRYGWSMRCERARQPEIPWAVCRWPSVGRAFVCASDEAGRARAAFSMEPDRYHLCHLAHVCWNPTRGQVMIPIADPALYAQMQEQRTACITAQRSPWCKCFMPTTSFVIVPYALYPVRPIHARAACAFKGSFERG
jgi:hypothetical protein